MLATEMINSNSSYCFTSLANIMSLLLVLLFLFVFLFLLFQVSRWYLMNEQKVLLFFPSIPPHLAFYLSMRFCFIVPNISEYCLCTHILFP